MAESTGKRATTTTTSLRKRSAGSSQTRGKDEVGQGEIPTTDVAGLIGEIRMVASPASGPKTRLRVAGMNVVEEKQKLSVTLDQSVVDEIREMFGSRPISTSINDLLHDALAQRRLNELVDELFAEAGPPSAAAYERVMAQWRGD
jgi:hypothetical protein